MNRFHWHEGGAVIDGPYRYRLWRTWAPTLPRCVFVMLNPSTADANQDDPTIRRCIAFATTWGYGSLDVVNLYALRATDPRELRRTDVDPYGGPRNWDTCCAAFAQAQLVVAAWGVHGSRHPRGRGLFGIPSLELHVLGLTKGGFPKHPLYVAGVTRPQVWIPATVRP